MSEHRRPAQGSLEPFPLDQGGRRHGLSTATIAGLTAAAVAVLAVVGVLLGVVASRFAGRADNGPSVNVAAVTKPLVTDVRPSAPEPFRAAPPRPMPKAPEPVAEPIRAEVQHARVSLPPASENSAIHDGGDHDLGLTLPRLDHYALRLHGLDDAEVTKLDRFLETRPARPGDSLTIVCNPARGGATLATSAEEKKLAQFWVKDARLHFQWVPELTASQLKATQALRDCSLEVVAGHVTVHVALRSLIVVPDELTARKGRTIGWQGEWELPIRKLSVASCQIKTETEGWEEVPPLASVGDWERLLAGKPGDPKDQCVILNIRPTDDLGKLAPSVPDTKKRVENARAAKAKCEKMISNLSTSLRVSNDRLARFEAYRRETAPSLVENGRAELDAQEAVFFEQTRVLEKNLTDEKKKLEEANRQLKVQEALRTAVEPFLSAPIRVKIEMTVEGQKVEVVRIGPW